jgi:intracellular sulfur oxidation DsrE/DsrF family protein
MGRFWSVLGMAIVCLLAVYEAQAGPVVSGYGQQKVVYHFNEKNWRVIRRGLRHIDNHLRVVGEKNVKIVVIAHGDGLVMLLRFYVPKDIEKKVADLRQRGVDFRACAGTLRRQRIKKPGESLVRCRVVPCGVCELVKLQQQGYAYIKP